TTLVLPLARLQLALDIDLAALAQILLGDPRQPLRKDHHPVPLGALLALAGVLVAPALRGGDPQVRDLATAGQGPHLGIGAEIAHQDHFVHAAGHGSLLPYLSAPAARPAAALV